MPKEIEIAKNRSNAILDQQYAVALDEWTANVVQEEKVRKLKDKQVLQDYKYRTAVKEAQEEAQLDAYKRSNDVYKNNLKSIDFYADTARSRVRLGLDEQIAALSFQLEDLDKDFAKRAASAAFGTSEQDQIVANAEEDASLANQELNIQKTQRLAEFDSKLATIEAEEQKIAGEFDLERQRLEQFDIREKGLERFDIQKQKLETEEKKLGTQTKKLRTETKYNQLNNQLESIVKTGSAKARGLKGRGADKMINSIAAMSGLNSQQFNDSLYLAEESIQLQKETLQLEKGSIQLQKGLEKDTIGLERSIAEKSISVQEPFAKEVLRIRKGLTKTEQQSYLGQLGVSRSKVEAGKRQTKAAADLRKNQIAETLGIDAEEVELSKKKLAETIMSAGESAQIKLEEIENKAFEAKNQSYAQRMLKPRFGPALPVPFKTPKTEYIKPRAPIYQSKGSIKGGSASGYVKPQQPSGLSTALGIGSALLGIAAPFTGGATAGILGGLSAGTGFLASLFK